MRITVVLALLAGIALAGEGRDEPFPGRQPPVRPGLPNPPITRLCEDIEADARALVDSVGACTTTCTLVSLETLAGPDSCTAALQCAAAVGEGFDGQQFGQVARALAEEKRACGECATAACMPPADLVALCVEGRCVLSPK